MEETKSIKVGALAQRIQGYKAYNYWKTALNDGDSDCTFIEVCLGDNKIETSLFGLESFAFAPKFNDPIKIRADYSEPSDNYEILNYFEPSEHSEILGFLEHSEILGYLDDSEISEPRYITYRNYSLVEKLLCLKEDNAHLFKPYLTSQDVNSIRKLIKSPIISQQEKLISLAFLFMVTSTKHNAFLLSLDKQESFYQRMQVFEQEKEIFEIYLENKIDFLSVLKFAFYPTSSYAFANYLLNTFEKEILSSAYIGIDKSIYLLDIPIIAKSGRSFFYEHDSVTFTPTPFRLIDICLVQAFFSARLDLMLLLEQKGANYEIFNTIFDLSVEEFSNYHFHYITRMYNLLEYEHHNPLKYLLQKGIRNQRFLERVLESANNFTKNGVFLESYMEVTRFFLQNQNNEEFDEAFRVYAKHVAFIEHTNAKVIQGIQIINRILRDYISKESKYYSFVSEEYNTLLNPLVQEQYNLFPESMEKIFVYCIWHFPQFYSQKYDSETIIKMLPKIIDKNAITLELKEFIQDLVTYDKDINYEFDNGFGSELDIELFDLMLEKVLQ